MGFRRRGFTLIELLVIIGIMGAMVTVSLVSVRSGQTAARTRGAVRDIFAAIRHARSVALVTQQPAIIEYSTQDEDGEVVAKIEITSAKLFNESVDRSKVETLTGAPVPVSADDDEVSQPATTTAKTVATDATKAVTAGANGATDGTAVQSESSGGQTIEDILFSPIDDSIVRGVRIKVLNENEELESGVAPVRKSRISVFSNVDYLLGKYKEAKSKAAASSSTSTSTSTSSTSTSTSSTPVAENQEPVSIVWETNGRVEPHKVWVYADGQRPEQGLCIVVDRFGGAKVVNGDGREED